MTQKLESLLQTEMSRKQFLGVLLSVIASILGVPAILGLFSRASNQPKSELPGYGDRNYGP